MTLAPKVSVRVTSQCSHIAVGAWYCGLLECALRSNTSEFNTQGFCKVTSQCSHIAVGAWYCGLLECALRPIPLNSTLKVSVRLPHSVVI